MNKLKFKFIFGGGLLILGAVWLLLGPQDNTTNDEGKLRQMVRAQRSAWRIRKIEGYLPLFLIRKLRLEGSRIDNEELAQAHKKALVTSGFLTNVSVAITNLSLKATNRYAATVEMGQRFRRVRGIDYWSFHMQSNQAIITCRPKDIARIQTVVGIP